jgi:protein CMS1
LENLPEFLEEFSDNAKELGEAPETKGSPHTIVVAGAGLRAAELVRALRKFQKKGNPVAKLVRGSKSNDYCSRGELTARLQFAKHIKMEEAVQFLTSHRTGIAVGTPVRLMDLLDNGSIDLHTPSNCL